MKTAEELLSECEELYSRRDYRGAIKTCDEIFEISPDHEIALGYKIRCLFELDLFEESSELLDYALKLYPDNHHYLHTKAEILMEGEDWDGAIECFERISDVDVSDKAALSFIRMDYEACLSQKIDMLIEREKYTEAFEIYSILNQDNLSRIKLIGKFKSHVQSRTSKSKRRVYEVRISSEDAKADLIEFLRQNGFEGGDDDAMILSVDVISKTYKSAQKSDEDTISESKFYDKVNYYPRGEISRERLFDDEGNLLYEGYVTGNNRPYGFGKAYFQNGNLYREGIFDIKGIVQGKEYYPTGGLRFEGQWSLTGGYGPNAPWKGDAYDEKGNMIFSGEFKIKRGGVGWPMIQNAPEGFKIEQTERPKIKYL